MKQYFDERNKELIHSEIIKFVMKIEKDIATNKKSMEQYGDILLIFSQLLDQECISIDNLNIKNIIKSILGKIKSQTKGLTINTNLGISMFSDWGSLVFAINNINKKTGELNNLSQQLNYIVADCLYEYIQDLKNKEIDFSSYDIIAGPSGALYYLLRCTNIIQDKKYTDKLEEVIRYIIFLSEDHDYKGHKVINFHIEKGKQFLEREKELMQQGHINFGLAHGMIGTLIALSETKKLNWKIDGVDIAIHKILDLYENFKIEGENNINFPTQLPLEDYLNLSKENIGDGNASWCYGNIGIVRGLMKVYKNIGQYDKYEYYKEKLIKMLNQPIHNYNLYSPIICHGYASVVVIQMSAFVETKDLRFIETIDRNMLELLNKHKELLNENRIDTEEEKEYGIRYYNDTTVLNGQGGIILTMLFALGEKINFNKILMVD